jgi:hypothetical protein
MTSFDAAVRVGCRTVRSVGAPVWMWAADTAVAMPPKVCGVSLVAA